MRSVRILAAVAALAIVPATAGSAGHAPAASPWQPKLVASNADGVAAFPGALYVVEKTPSLAGGTLHRSTDGGVTWTRSPLPNRPLRFEMATPDVGYLLAIAGGTPLLYRTTDAGASWKKLDLTFPTHGTNAWHLGVARGGTTVVATSDDMGAGSNLCATPSIGRVFVSTDSGSTFRSTRLPVRNARVDNVAVSPGGEIALAVGGYVTPDCQADVAGVWTSENAGRSYSRALACADCAFVARPSARHLVTSTVWGMARVSTDGGRAWSAPVAAVSTTAPVLGVFVQDIAFSNASIGYVSTANGGLHRTTDGGLTWAHEASVYNVGLTYGRGPLDAFGNQGAIVAGSETVLVRT